MHAPGLLRSATVSPFKPVAIAILHRFILYSRSYCHLCDDMLAALKSHPAADDFQIDVRDIDADEELVRRYDELVPVLAGVRADGSHARICHYFLDRQALDAFLSA